MRNLRKFFIKARQERDLSPAEVIAILECEQYLGCRMKQESKLAGSIKQHLKFFKLVKNKMITCTKLHRYCDLGNLLQIQWNNPLFVKLDPSFLYWHQAIYEFYYNHDEFTAMGFLEDALHYTPVTDYERRIEINKTIGAIHAAMNNPKQAGQLIKEPKSVRYKSNLSKQRSSSKEQDSSKDQYSSKKQYSSHKRLTVHKEFD